MCFGAPAAEEVRVRWDRRARMKYRNHQMANPLHSVDHGNWFRFVDRWDWFHFGACRRCAAHAVEVNGTAVGWDWYDASDSLPELPVRRLSPCSAASRAASSPPPQEPDSDDADAPPPVPDSGDADAPPPVPDSDDEDVPPPPPLTRQSGDEDQGPGPFDAIAPFGGLSLRE
jgi:hypothetical protein